MMKLQQKIGAGDILFMQSHDLLQNSGIAELGNLVK